MGLSLLSSLVSPVSGVRLTGVTGYLLEFAVKLHAADVNFSGYECDGPGKFVLDLSSTHLHVWEGSLREAPGVAGFLGRPEFIGKREGKECIISLQFP